MVLQWINPGDAVPLGYRRVSDAAEIMQICGEVLGWSDIRLADFDFYQHTGVPPASLQDCGGLRPAFTRRRPSNHCILPSLIRARPEIEGLLEKMQEEDAAKEKG
jgi:hypothetical protein